jgi:hypothetical protein
MSLGAFVRNSLYPGRSHYQLIHGRENVVGVCSPVSDHCDMETVPGKAAQQQLVG